MKVPRILPILVVFLWTAVVPAADTLLHEQSLQPSIHVNARITEDFTVGVRGFLHTGPTLDQIEVLGVPLIEKGYNGQGLAPYFWVKAGRLEKIEFTVGAEVLLLKRLIEKDTFLIQYPERRDAPDYFESRPTGIITLTRPFAGLFQAQYVHRFERRNFRAPNFGEGKTGLRNVSRLSLSLIPATVLRVSPYLYYEGYVQKTAWSHISASGAGITLEPIKGLSLAAAYNVRWTPDYSNESEQQIAIDLGYTFNFAK